jgi:hypothetical protein
MKSETELGPLRATALICGLWALAVAQPLCDLMGRQPEFLVAHDLSGRQVVALALLLSCAVPLLLGAAVGLLGCLRPALRRGSTLAIAALLTAALTLQMLGRAPHLPGWLAVGMAAAIGVGGAVGLARSPAVLSLAMFLAPAAVVVPGVFLFSSPAHELLEVPATSTDAAPRAVPATSQVPGTAAPRPPVVLLILDELPLFSLLDGSHQIDADRFPGFARLARQATWFRGASTVGSNTTVAVPAILTGRRPTRALVPTAHDHPESFFRLFAPSHDLRVIETVTHLCPRGLCADLGLESDRERWRATLSDLEVVYLHLLLPADLRHHLPAVDQDWRDFSQHEPGGSGDVDDKGADPDGDPDPPPTRSDVPALFARFLATFSDHDRARPTAHVLHLVLPHIPWRYLPSGRRYRLPAGWVVPEGLAGEQWSAAEWPTVLGWQRHLAQAIYADHLLGRLLDELDQDGIYDRAVLAVVADHGASFIPGESRRAPSAANFPEILSVPLLVKLPGQHTGRIDDRNVETIDLLPTLAAASGLSIPWAIDGHDLFASDFPQRANKTLFHAGKGSLQGVHTYPADLLARDGQLRRRLGLFATGPAEHTLFRLGPHPELIGRDVAAQPAAPPAALSVVFDDPLTLSDVDLEADPLPALVSGRLEGPAARPDLALSLALGGVIRANTWSFAATDGSPRFAVLLPESALVDGASEVALMVQEGDAPALSATSNTAPAAYAWRDGNVIDSDGRPITWQRGELRAIARRSQDGLSGWVKPPPGRSPTRVLVFSAGELIASSALRPGKNQLGREPRERGGFPFTVALPPDQGDDAQLRVIVLFGDTAGRIGLADGRPAAGSLDHPRRREKRPRHPGPKPPGEP